MVPVIETARLRLREYRASDFDDQLRTLSDPRVLRFLGSTPASREENWRKTLAGYGSWGMLGYGYWTLERKEDARWIGMLGFGDFKRDMKPSIDGFPEIGWILAPETQGQGYASEAATAAMAWADEALGRREIVAIISHGNAASIRVAEKAGLTWREEAIYKDEPILLFRRRV
jgi:RimJ/RimL family protein N-acetyltransferase